MVGASDISWRVLLGKRVGWNRLKEGGTLGHFGWGCAPGTLEPLAYTRASSSEFCYPILD